MRFSVATTAATPACLGRARSIDARNASTGGVTIAFDKNADAQPARNLWPFAPTRRWLQDAPRAEHEFEGRITQVASEKCEATQDPVSTH
jgi:hypothetical protein